MKKKIIQVEKEKKITNAAFFVVTEFQAGQRTMSQPVAVCCNKVQAELKAKIEYLSRQRVLYRDTAEEEYKEDCRDTLNSVATMIKANGKGTLSQQSFLCHNIKS